MLALPAGHSSQAPALSAPGAAKEPASHGVQVVAPFKALVLWPSEQGRHSSVSGCGAYLARGKEGGAQGDDDHCFLAEHATWVHHIKWQHGLIT